MAAAFLIFFVAVYWPVMLREEEFLRQNFGEAYDHYAQVVPLFFPKLFRRAPDRSRFRWELYRTNHEYEAALGYVAGIVFLAMKIWLR